MRRVVEVLVLALALAAVAVPARGDDNLRASVVRTEELRQLLREALQRPDSGDLTRVRRGMQRLEESLAGTPYRGAASTALRDLDSARVRSAGGELPPEVAEGLETKLAALSESLRRLMKFEIQNPPSGEAAEETAAWRKRLARILDEEDLRYGEEGEGLLERAVRKAEDALGRALRWLFSLRPVTAAGPILTRLVLAVLLGIVAIVLSLWLVRRGRGRRRLAASGERDEPAAVPLTDPRRHWQEALAAARDGRWDDAVRAGYLHLLAVLELAGVTAAETRTNAEVLEDLRRAGAGTEAAAALARANAVFDRARYGRRPCGRPGWEAFRGAAETTLHSVEAPR